MRVISRDRTIDAPYENNTFYVIQDGDKWSIVMRSIDFRLYAPMATYDTEAEAIEALRALREGAHGDIFEL